MDTRYTSMAAMVACSLTLALSGCAPFASLPPIEAVPQALVRPSYPPFPSVMAEAITYANHTYGEGTDDFVYNLPLGSSYQLYELVSLRLQERASGVGRPMQHLGEPAFHLDGVRVRGFRAEADLIYPGTDGVHEMITLKLQHELGRGWFVNDTREWSIPVSPPKPTYVEPVDLYAGTVAEDEPVTLSQGPSPAAP